MFANGCSDIFDDWQATFRMDRVMFALLSRWKLISVIALLSIMALGVSKLISDKGDRNAAEKTSELALFAPELLNDVELGVVDAPVTIIEYASLGCSHCAQFALNTLPQIREKYIITSKVRYILRPFPLDARSTGAYMLTRCVAPDRYYALVHSLFRQQHVWATSDKPVDALISAVRLGGMSAAETQKCLADQKLLNDINAVRAHAEQHLGVTGTPTFFINGQEYQGDLTFEKMSAIIDKLID